LETRSCSNHVGYGKDGDPDAWGARACGAKAVRDCTRCHEPACPTHLDIDPEGRPNAKPVCCDCYEAENHAIGQRLSVRNAKASAVHHDARIARGRRNAVSKPPARETSAGAILA
jgi:hypothetical protein